MVGIDISETLIGEAQQVGADPCVQFQIADAHAMPYAIRSFAMAADLLQLGDTATASWLQELQERDSHGTFFAAMTGFTVNGRVPRLRPAS